MEETQKKKIAIYNKYKIKASREFNTCLFPDCNESSTNCHILQKKGVLKKIIENQHARQLNYNLFETPSIYLKHTGHNNLLSFYCFCNDHDSIFLPIEQEEIDFNPYKNQLLFLIRSKLYEKYKKQVSIKQYSYMLEEDIYSSQEKEHFRKTILQWELGVKDINKMLTLIWNDYSNETESFIFKLRDIPQKPIAVSSFLTYETTNELKAYYFQNGKEKNELSSIFITIFPYHDYSKLIIAYKKSCEPNLEEYVNEIVKFEGESLDVFISNLLLFNSDTWIVSESFYQSNILPREEEVTGLLFHDLKGNERDLLYVNIFQC